MASSKPKRECVTCGKSKGQLFKETNTGVVVCSVGCAKDALKATPLPGHVSVHAESPVGQALGMLHDQIGSEMMAKLLKKDQKEYKWHAEGREHQVPAHLHNVLDAHLGAKRKKEDGEEDEEDDEDDEDITGGEKSRVRKEVEGVVAFSGSSDSPVPTPAIPLLNTQGKVATSLDQILDFEVWKIIFRQGGWETFEALFDPYVIRWARESPIEFIQYVTDLSVYEPIPTSYFIKILKKKNVYDINAMFVSVLAEPEGDVQFMFSKYFAVWDGNVLNYPYSIRQSPQGWLSLGYTAQPGTTATSFEYDYVKRVIDAGHPVHFGPFPAWLFYPESNLTKSIPRLLERLPLHLPPEVVAVAAFSAPVSFDLYLEAAKKAGTNLKEIFAELYTRLEMLKENQSWANALFHATMPLGAESLIANLEKLDDYGGKGVTKVLKEIGHNKYIDAYAKRKFPLVDMDEIEQEYVSTFISRVGRDVKDYKDMGDFLNGKKSENERISNENVVKIMALFLVEQIFTGYLTAAGEPTDVAKQIITDYLDHVTDISTLVTRRNGNVELPFVSIVHKPEAKWIMKKFAKASNFTLTPLQVVAYQNMVKFAAAELNPAYNDIVSRIKVAVPAKILANALPYMLMEYSGPGDDVFFAKEYTNLGRLAYIGEGMGYIREFGYVCVENTYLQTLADSQVSTNSKAQKVLTAQWIADRCNLFEKDNLYAALFALHRLEEEQKRLVSIYGQSERATYDNLMRNLRDEKIYIWQPSTATIQPVLVFDAIFTQVEKKTTSPRDVIAVRRLYADALEMASNRMSADDKQKFRSEMITAIQNGLRVENVILPETAFLFAEKFGDRDFLISLSRTAKDVNVQSAAFEKLNYEKVEDWVEWLAAQHSGYNLDDSKRKMVIKMLKVAMEKFGGATVAAALKGGKFIHNFIFESYRDDLAFELVQLLLPYYSMDTIFRNGDTFLHYLVEDVNRLFNPLTLTEQYEKSFKTVPNLLALDSDGVSVIGRYFWKREHSGRNTLAVLRELGDRYPQFANAKVLPSTLLGIKNARTNFGTVSGDLVEKAKVFTGLKNDNAVIDAKYPDGRWWWMSDNLLGGNELKKIMDMYKQNRAGISGTKKTPDGDTALHLYLKRRWSVHATDVVFYKSEMNEMFKIPDTNVSDKNNDGDTPVHLFIQRANKRDRKNVEALKKLIQHHSFDAAITNKDGLTPKQLAARLDKPTFVNAFDGETFSKSEVKSAVNKEQMDDADEVVDSMQM